MYTILVPLDGSGFAEQAIPVARAIALRQNARLELVTVYSAAASRERAGAPPRPSVVREYLDTYLQRMVQELRAVDSTIDIDARLLDGEIVDTIRDHATAIGANLVVLTTHARGGLSRAWLGSVADGIARTASMPVLAIRPTEPPPPPAISFRHVLVALDGTPESEEAIEHAVTVAGQAGVRYTLVQVITPLHPMVRAASPARAFDDDLREQRATAESYLGGLTARLRDRHIDAAFEVRTESQPASGILSAAGESGADLIALATHGRRGLSRFFLGSVADKVLRAASVPVLLARATAS